MGVVPEDGMLAGLRVFRFGVERGTKEQPEPGRGELYLVEEASGGFIVERCSFVGELPKRIGGPFASIEEAVAAAQKVASS